MCQVSNSVTDKTVQHPFERAGLGIAPFRFLRMTENVINHPGGTQQAGGHCDYCFTGIRYEFWVSDATGKEFKVGSDCVGKLFRGYNVKTDPVLVAVNAERRKLQRESRHAREAVQIREGMEWLKCHRRELATFPHPYAESGNWADGMTFLDYVEFILKNAGTSGTLRTIKMAKKKIAG